MRVRVRNHVNPLGPAFDEFRGRRPALAPGIPVELEIGCADAQFLFERAVCEPGRRYLGLEIREELVDAVNARAAAEGAPVEAVFCNANRHLRALLPAASVARVYVNFPDPWFKRRHQKRRMVDEGLGRDIAHLLPRGGELFVQTDVWDIALDALAAFESLDDRLQNRAGPWSFWKHDNPFGARSWRETRCTRSGYKIWRLYYVRT